MTERKKPQERVTWKPLPRDFLLPKEPVENLEHSILTMALEEFLDAVYLVTPSIVIASKLAICAWVDEQIIVKAPDLVYIGFVAPIPEGKIRSSYIPHLDGDVPSIVIEFLSDRPNGEYDRDPGGKWWFYEKILQVPKYAIFYPNSGQLEVYELHSGSYLPQIVDKSGSYWIPGVNLFLGVLDRGNKPGSCYSLRWWDYPGNILLSKSEKIARMKQWLKYNQHRSDVVGGATHAQGRVADAQQFAADAKIRAREATQRVERLMARLRKLDIYPRSD